MGRRWWVLVVVALVGVAAVVFAHRSDCTAHAASTAPPTTSADSPLAATPRTAETPAPDLSAAVARAAEAGVGADLGLAVVDLDTGAVAGHNADTPFRSASLSKLLVAVDLLTAGEVPQEDLQRLERALGSSDDNAMNALWTLHDGLGAITRVAAQAGLTATRAPEDASQWGDVEMSANDVVRLYRHILTALPAADREFVVSTLSATTPTAADGFDQAYGLLAPGVDAYVKQGWMWYVPADFYLHTTGVVANRHAVAVLSIHTGVGEQTAKNHVTALTSILLDALAPAG